MMIYEALADLGVPVCHPPYKGGEETYITYQLLGQSGQIYAEGGEAETGVQYAVSIFAEGFAAGLLKRVKAALEAAGYIATVDMETYEKETGRTQIALIAETEGAAYVMRASELVKKHIDVAKNYKTVYMWGCFGYPVTDGIITEKAKQYPDWYDDEKQAKFRGLIGKGYFGFDCVNLTKGILWGWNGNKNAYHGGARYAGNAVPDVSADGMIAKCKDVSASGWDKLVPGEGLWMPGHWGLYIGDGLAVECTPIWDNGVQITGVGNIGVKGGYNSRVWKKHGKLPWVDYDTETVDKAVEDAKKTIKAKAGLADNTIKYLADYKYGDDLLKKLAAAMR